MENTGETRVTTSTIEFRSPFRIGRDPRELPAGSYTVHTTEDIYQGAFDRVGVAVSVDFMVEITGGSTCRIVKPADLRAALERDAQQPDEASENPDRGCSDRTRSHVHI